MDSNSYLDANEQAFLSYFMNEKNSTSAGELIRQKVARFGNRSLENFSGRE